MKKISILIIMALVIFGCQDQGLDDESENATPNGSQPEASYNISGVVQDGFCETGGIVTIFILSDEDGLPQTGASFQTSIINNLGEFIVSSRVTSRFVEAFAEARCLNEVTGETMGYKTLSSLIDLSEGSTHTISPLTTVRSPRLRGLYSGDNFTNIRTQAESEILELFGLPGITRSFSELDIAGDSTDDAVLIVANSMMLYGKDINEQMVFMTDLGDAVRRFGSGGTLALQTELQESEQGLPLQSIKDNLNAKYVELGYEEKEFSSFWKIVDSDGDGIPNSQDPDQVIEMDFIERSPVIQGSFNLGETRTQPFADGSVHYFALPYIFPSSVENAKYIGISWDADYMSIYNNNDMGTDSTSDDMPGVELFKIDKIPVNYFTGSYSDTSREVHSNLPGNFHADLGNNQIPHGQPVWIVMSKDEDYNPMIGYSGGPVTFSKNHFSDDGVNWYPTGIAPIYTQMMWRAFWTD